jgi:hypothetical protein
MESSLNIDEKNLKLKFVKNKVYSKKINQNEIFISRKRKNVEKFYYERAYELFYKLGFKEIFIYGLGACVNYAAKLSLHLVENLPNLKIDKIETETINHIDDYKNIDDDRLFIRKNDRMSNLIKIKLIKE